jgi:hypothetical protein
MKFLSFRRMAMVSLQLFTQRIAYVTRIFIAQLLVALQTNCQKYRPCSNRRMPAKLVPAFADRGCRMVSATDPYGSIVGFLDLSRYFFFQAAPQLYT